MNQPKSTQEQIHPKIEVFGIVLSTGLSFKIGEYLDEDHQITGVCYQRSMFSILDITVWVRTGDELDIVDHVGDYTILRLPPSPDDD